MNLTRPGASLAYVLGAIGLVSTCTVTILDGVCYAVAKSLRSHVSAIECGIVSLSVVSCLALFALVLTWGTDLENGLRRPWQGWRAITYGTAMVYFSLATGITAGAIAWSAAQSIAEADKSTLAPKQRTFMVVRCVVWAISVLSQGLLGGCLLTSTSKRRHRSSPWPGSFSQELAILPDASSSTRPGSPSKTPSLVITESGGMPASAASLVSNRYSGRTLTHHDSKRSSVELHPQYLSYPDAAVTRSGADDSSHKLQRSSSQVKRSLDSLVPRSASGRSSQVDESHIHPLFRTDSPSPAPTPTPGTVVVASPAAGQTISRQTLNRVRSANSLRSYNSSSSRGRSPLPVDQRDPGPVIPSFMMAADVRRSITRYEKKYDLHESPLEG